uniref:Ankyrin repeat protein n=1 Tax=Panagrolaimus sp. ES5 TaxID=591445 RepID=A0AC34GXM8_9BILA
MHSLQRKLGATESVLNEIEVEQAFIKSICDNFTFEERKLDLLNVKEKLTTDVQRFNFYKCVIRLIKYNQEEFGDGVQDIWVLEEQLNIFKEKIKDFKEPPTIITNIPFEDECDAISDDQILEALEEKWIYFDKIQSFKKKLEKIDVYGETELYKEISPNVELGHIKFLIDECGYDEILEKPDNAGITPLMKAIMIDRTDIIEYLLEKGANANPAMSKNEKLEKIDVYGETELYKEISPNVELGHIKFLIDECGYDEILEKPDNAGITPLMKAIMIDRTDIIEYLLEKGANANPAMSKNEDPLIGATPLMEAVRQRNCDAIRLLLQHKANPIAKNKLGETAIDLMNDQLKFGRTYLSNIISGPKRAKKESPMTQEKYDELKEAKKFLMEAEKEYIENYGEYLQNVDENVNENPTFNGMGKR